MNDVISYVVTNGITQLDLDADEPIVSHYDTLDEAIAALPPIEQASTAYDPMDDSDDEFGGYKCILSIERRSPESSKPRAPSVALPLVYRDLILVVTNGEYVITGVDGPILAKVDSLDELLKGMRLTDAIRGRKLFESLDVIQQLADWMAKCC
jgi:hypothetical protein